MRACWKNEQGRHAAPHLSEVQQRGQLARKNTHAFGFYRKCYITMRPDLF